MFDTCTLSSFCDRYVLLHHQHLCLPLLHLPRHLRHLCPKHLDLCQRLPFWSLRLRRRMWRLRWRWRWRKRRRRRMTTYPLPLHQQGLLRRGGSHHRGHHQVQHVCRSKFMVVVDICQCPRLDRLRGQDMCQALWSGNLCLQSLTSLMTSCGLVCKWFENDIMFATFAFAFAF